MAVNRRWKYTLAGVLAVVGFGLVLSDVEPAAAAASSAATPAACRVLYAAAAGTNLLFGGVHGACVKGCQPRDDRWSQSCDVAKQAQPPEMAAYPGHDACLPSQTAAVLAAMQQQHDYAVLQQFSPCALARLLQGRTLWVVGDSQMRNTYFALRCFMLDFWDHSLGECAVSSNRQLQKSIYQAADTNITSSMGSRVITDVPVCVHLVQGGRICWVHSVRGEEFADADPQAPGLLQVLQNTVASSDDIFFLNFGRWHYTNCEGLQEEPYKRALQNLGRLYQNTRSTFPNVLFKVPAHDHTACKDGQRLELDQCVPAGRGNYSMAVGRSLTSQATHILSKYGLPVLDTHNLTVGMHMAHIAKDCLHYCSPGVPEAEIFAMYKELRHHGVKPIDSSSSSSGSSSNTVPSGASIAAGQPAGQAAADDHVCVPVFDTRKPPAGWSARYDELMRNRTSRKPAIMEEDLY